MDNQIKNDIEDIKQCLHHIKGVLKNIYELLNRMDFEIDKERYYTIHGTMEGYRFDWEDRDRKE